MNIVEKKCPNCNANLEFKVGEKDVKCPHCRRDFAIEYDHEIDPEIQMKAKDITLKIMNDFERNRKISKVSFVFFVVVFIAIFSFVTFMIVRGFIETEQRHNESSQRRAEMEQEWEQEQKEFDEAQKQREEAHKQMEERVLEMMEEQMKQAPSSN